MGSGLSGASWRRDSGRMRPGFLRSQRRSMPPGAARGVRSQRPQTHSGLHLVSQSLWPENIGRKPGVRNRYRLGKGKHLMRNLLLCLNNSAILK